MGVVFLWVLAPGVVLLWVVRMGMVMVLFAALAARGRQRKTNGHNHDHDAFPNLAHLLVSSCQTGTNPSSTF
jgi:hypothetical protein